MMDWLTLSDILGMPADISTHGFEIDLTMGLVHWLMIILFLVWAPYFLYTLYRFRASKNPDATYEGSESTWSSYLELGVIVAETVLLVGFAFPIWNNLKQDFPDEEEAVVVHVIGQQFTWQIHYPGPDGIFGRRDTSLVDVQTNPIGLDREDPYAEDDIVSNNELHLPVDRPTIVHLTSMDVIHSLFLPPLRVKQDAIPGLSIPVWFEPTETGEWDIACAQLCGVGHYRMRGYLTIHTQEEYQAWLDSEAPGASGG